MGTKQVPVVSWVLHVDTSMFSDISSGGFTWHPSMESAWKTLEHEMLVQRGGHQLTRLRLIVVEVPEELDGQALTDYLEQERSEEIEETGTPLKEIYVV